MTTQDHLNLLCQVLNASPFPARALARIQNFSEEEWDTFLGIAAKQNLSMALYSRLCSPPDTFSIPTDISNRLHNIHLSNTARNMLLLHHAEGIISHLVGANVPVIGLKGIYLLDNIYPNIGDRVLNDIDLLVPRSHLSRALKLMEALGYQQTAYFSTKDENNDIKHIPPFIKPGGPYVEIHWSIVEADWGFKVDPQGLWERALSSKIGSIEALSLSYEDLVLHLAIHFTYQHRLRAGLGALYDIHVVLERIGNQVDWDMLVSRAHDWRVNRVLHLTLTLLYDLFGTHLPQNALERLLERPGDPQVIIQAKAQIFQEPIEEAVMVTPDLARLASATRWRDKVSIVMKRIFLPRHIMARLYNVQPDSPALIYNYLLRLQFLFKNYARSTWQILAKHKGAIESAHREDDNQQLLRWMEGQ